MAAVDTTTRSDKTRKLIVDAAVECIGRYGVQKTSLEDIAAEAGVGRKTIYRLVGGRSALIEAVLINRFECNTAAIKSVISTCDSFEEALVKGSMATVGILRADPIHNAILKESREMGFEISLLSSKTQAAHFFRSIWKDEYKRASDKQAIKSNINFAEFSEIMRSIQYIVAIRNDMDEKNQQRFFRMTLLPILCPDGEKE